MSFPAAGGACAHGSCMPSPPGPWARTPAGQRARGQSLGRGAAKLPSWGRLCRPPGAAAGREQPAVTHVGSLLRKLVSPHCSQGDRHQGCDLWHFEGLLLCFSVPGSRSDKSPKSSSSLQGPRGPRRPVSRDHSTLQMRNSTGSPAGGGLAHTVTSGRPSASAPRSDSSAWVSPP